MLTYLYASSDLAKSAFSSSSSSLLTSAAVRLQKARIRVIVAMEVSVFQALDKFFGSVIWFNIAY
jgi:hypothetical protein